MPDRSRLRGTTLTRQTMLLLGVGLGLVGVLLVAMSFTT